MLPGECQTGREATDTKFIPCGSNRRGWWGGQSTLTLLIWRGQALGNGCDPRTVTMTVINIFLIPETRLWIAPTSSQCKMYQKNNSRKCTPGGVHFSFTLRTLWKCLSLFLPSFQWLLFFWTRIKILLQPPSNWPCELSLGNICHCVCHNLTLYRLCSGDLWCLYRTGRLCRYSSAVLPNSFVYVPI